MPKCHAFTYEVPKKEHISIIVDVKIGISIDTANKTLYSTKGLIDTGASASCISKQFAEFANLKAFSMASVSSAQGNNIVPVYLVDIILPNDVIFPDLRVTEFFENPDFAVIIGMDILSRGDLSITNANRVC
ncbi:MAG: retropepsin-like aspartic protease [Spirochaetales bacterium]